MENIILSERFTDDIHPKNPLFRKFFIPYLYIRQYLWRFSNPRSEGQTDAIIWRIFRAWRPWMWARNSRFWPEIGHWLPIFIDCQIEKGYQFSSGEISLAISRLSEGVVRVRHIFWGYPQLQSKHIPKCVLNSRQNRLFNSSIWSEKESIGEQSITISN